MCAFKGSKRGSSVTEHTVQSHLFRSLPACASEEKIQMSAALALIWFYNSLRGHPQPEKGERVQVDEAENCGRPENQIVLNEEK